MQKAQKENDKATTKENASVWVSMQEDMSANMAHEG